MITKALRFRSALPLRVVGVGLALLATGTAAQAQVHAGPQPDAPAEAAPNSDAPQTVDELMQRLRTMPGLFARFEERKTIALLAVPLVNHGFVRFHPPGQLLRAVEKPHPSSVVLRKDDIWLAENGKTEHIDLHAHPAARSFVGSFRALLAGDRAALDAHFILSLNTDAQGVWTLELAPRSEGMKKIVIKMSIRGKGDQLQQLRIEEASGDVSDTRFFDVDTRHKHSAQDVERYFAVPHS
ncbi:MAG: LolA family protein [Nannocystales bacterium]